MATAAQGITAAVDSAKPVGHPNFIFGTSMQSKAKHAIRAIVGAVLMVAVRTAGRAHAGDMCSRYDKASVGKYVVQNNAWNDRVHWCPNNNRFAGCAVQCIKLIDQAGAHDQDFAVIEQTARAPDSAPASYPSVYIGCHYGTCSAGTNLPISVDSIGTAKTTIRLKYAGDPAFVFDAAYDIWLDPRPTKDGKNAREIMIWLDKQGDIQPIGSKVGNAKIADRNWQVWCGPNGITDVISYVAPSAISDVTFNVLDFIASVRDFVARFPACGKKTDGFYLTSIQAGFEPWKGGVGLAIERFQASVKAK